MLESNNDNRKNTSIQSTLLIELQYLPPVSYFRQIMSSDIIIIEAFETFQKQTFRNRCEILTANGRESLIIPIEHKASHPIIKDVKIDYSQRWASVHERSIRSAYGKSPFFDFFIGDFSAVWTKKYTYLWDLNYELLTLCLQLLKIKKKIIPSEMYLLSENELFKEIKDLRNSISPNEYGEYRQNGVKKYQQVFGNEFAKDLSIIDLLFCAMLDSSELLH
ncbi:MAG: WbqC family protein [Cytophagales bacterium]|nr:WbqC family protein [Cytophaga sp.]